MDTALNSNIARPVSEDRYGPLKAAYYVLTFFVIAVVFISLYFNNRMNRLYTQTSHHSAQVNAYTRVLDDLRGAILALAQPGRTVFFAEESEASGVEVKAGILRLERMTKEMLRYLDQNAFERKAATVESFRLAQAETPHLAQEVTALMNAVLSGDQNSATAHRIGLEQRSSVILGQIASARTQLEVHLQEFNRIQDAAVTDFLVLEYAILLVIPLMVGGFMVYGSQLSTKIKNIEESEWNRMQLQKLNSDLEERVALRTEELKQSEARMQAIFENMGEGLILLDEEEAVFSMNPAAERIFCAEAMAVKGRGVVTLFADSSETASTFLGRMSSNQPVELQGRRMDGTTFPMEVVMTSMGKEDESLRVCLLRDITGRKEAQHQLEETQHRLVETAHKSGMAEIAIGVLHNIGNILNSVALSGDEITRILAKSNVGSLLQANALLASHQTDVADFLANTTQGKMLPQFYLRVGEALSSEIKTIGGETKSLNEKIRVMKEVISSQQAYAREGVSKEVCDIAAIIEDALRMQEVSLKKAGVEVNRKFQEVPYCRVHKSQLLQVLINLIKNASEAMSGNDDQNKRRVLTIEAGDAEDGFLPIVVRDTGCGICEENLVRIFNHGFSTKLAGHGFGLHTSALALTNMGGRLKADSGGEGQGAVFTLLLSIAESVPV